MVRKDVELIVQQPVSGFKLRNEQSLEYHIEVHLQKEARKGSLTISPCSFISALVWRWPKRACWATDARETLSRARTQWGFASQSSAFTGIAARLCTIFIWRFEVAKPSLGQDECVSKEAGNRSPIQSTPIRLPRTWRCLIARNLSPL